MAEWDDHHEQILREAAYFVWEREGRPDGQADEHWRQAIIHLRGVENPTTMEDEEKVIAGHPGANISAMLTKDVPGG
jgi:hypothetical protein